MKRKNHENKDDQMENELKTVGLMDETIEANETVRESEIVKEDSFSINKILDSAQKTMEESQFLKPVQQLHDGISEFSMDKILDSAQKTMEDTEILKPIQAVHEGVEIKTTDFGIFKQVLIKLKEKLIK